ncbi:MAG: prepilin-type N-terminal cleavage/methylation domain-containing protein [Desulfobacteraceae bacterium]|jgi:type IV pilus assembly protein PilW|nr:prepilin-type N-terminal cleavage/methylation domain-containing protein [Desulfobacteraceae bacterium]
MNFVKTTPNLAKGKRGFSLIELLVALVIMSVVSVAIYGVFSVSSRTYTTQSVTAGVQQSVRSAMEVMLQDIRAAGLDPTASGNFGIELAEDVKLRFTSDSIDAGLNDFNGVIDDTNAERITYVLQGTQLNQILYETTDSEKNGPLISDVQNLKFTYFDADGNNLGSPVPPLQLAEIRIINVSITVEEPAGRSAPVRRTLTNGVKCRNRGL